MTNASIKGTLQTLPKYTAMHMRVKRLRGPARAYPCAAKGCRRKAAQWAYDGMDPMPLTERRSGSLYYYSTDPDHYVPMCIPCHRAYDAAPYDCAAAHPGEQCEETTGKYGRRCKANERARTRRHRQRVPRRKRTTPTTTGQPVDGGSL